MPESIIVRKDRPYVTLYPAEFRFNAPGEHVVRVVIDGERAADWTLRVIYRRASHPVE